MSLRVAILSVHTCPLAVLGGKETGGMNVYVRELARELGRMGVRVDVFTRSQNPTIPRVVTLGEGVRVMHLPRAPRRRCRASGSATTSTSSSTAWRRTASRGGLDYDLIHAHYWLSGAVGLVLRERWACRWCRCSTRSAGSRTTRRAPSQRSSSRRMRIDEEARIVGAVDRIVAANDGGAHPPRLALRRRRRLASP